MHELDEPLEATITTFDELDLVGRLRTRDGEDLRFGASACRAFAPLVGMRVFVTAIAPHALGGRRATSVREVAITEAAFRAAEDERRATERARAEEERARRRAEVRPHTTGAAIVRRIREAAVAMGGSFANPAMINDLVRDLRLVGPSPGHVRSILRGIAESDPSTDFGAPGSLVHFVEGSPVPTTRRRSSRSRRRLRRPTSPSCWRVSPMPATRAPIERSRCCTATEWTRSHPSA
ncbi:hypothetical protein [Sandaracinus amylolyticus]|uniref:Uncharacterized protein n=1 Tax=Sandaracinus amylolyticus TaxID=927083 RepID=A0A0F6SGI6_9BACT|nr:hypothetical protein [Sandaracinus amylolyticus]AKF08759.1 hypothetical protein DB32_005908 [Sandaracinus amylolyticus]